VPLVHDDPLIMVVTLVCSDWARCKAVWMLLVIISVAFLPAAGPAAEPSAQLCCALVSSDWRRSMQSADVQDSNS
jgi:hypothetical protein